MNENIAGLTPTLMAISTVALGTFAFNASATSPCGDFGECKTLIEINASDGDVGFHFLMDGNELVSAKIEDPNGKKIFEEKAKGQMKGQTLTETFVESAEPLCWHDPEADDDELVVSLEEFLARWAEGTYKFEGKEAQGSISQGQTELSYVLPAAPADLEFDGDVISWSPGDDLGNCATYGELHDLVNDGNLPVHPVDVEVALWEIVLVPDVDDGDLAGSLKYSIRVAGDIAITEVSVPIEYLASLDDDTPAKIEVGAIGFDDNATFAELGEICLNEVEGCDEE